MPGRTLRRLACALLLAASAVVSAPGARSDPEWRQRAERVPVHYILEAELTKLRDEELPRQIKGRATIILTNTTRDRIEHLWFHLYGNAFRDEDSAFVREMLRDGKKLPDPMVWGGSEMSPPTLVGSTTGRQPTLERILCPDAPEDRTVYRATLPQAVEPGGEIVLQFQFTTTLPRPIARMGAANDFVMAAQWYPKLGRFLGSDSGVPWAANLKNGWYCPHYHAAPEFAADFADYDVTLTLPASWNVGATGVPVGSEVRNEDAGTATRVWQAKSVVDFAWAAGLRLFPDMRRIDPDGPGLPDAVREEIRTCRSLLPSNDWDLPPVDVVLLLQPEHRDQAERHFEAARVALALYGTWLGPYPYPRLTIVDPPHDVPVGGMEYPMLVTAGTTIGSPPAARRVEHLVVHEIGHQWFMNLLASNETEEAWLDEGLNTWFTARAMHVAWGVPTQLTSILGMHFPTELPYTFPGLTAGWPDALGLPAWLQPPDLEMFRLWRDAPVLFGTQGLRYRLDQDPFRPSRRSWLRAAGSDELIRTGWEYASGDSYRANAYPRAVLILETLADHVRARYDRLSDRDGERRVLRAFREYARQYRFEHPTTADLLKVLRRETEVAELGALFDALAKTTGALDYAIESVRIEEPKKRDGEPQQPKSVVRVRRRGEVIVPVTVRVHVEDVKEPLELEWTGAERWKDFPVEGRVRTAAVDPDCRFAQDARLSDNVWTHRRSAQPTAKWGTHFLVWLENALAGWGRFF